ncbi:hypothetical protein KDK_38790 [Dictyobacter kobayashii]|uniref:Uncharacterized protein n=1 Tax=Dictyobacter kobayashii TaxID=2014872 RepID=A0A402AM11_9CHLR|nr:hypothetical protein KDK_38790 [Dictyobacter kobayashii]
MLKAFTKDFGDRLLGFFAFCFACCMADIWIGGRSLQQVPSDIIYLALGAATGIFITFPLVTYIKSRREQKYLHNDMDTNNQ